MTYAIYSYFIWGLICGIEKLGGAKFGGANPPGIPAELTGGGSIGLKPGIPGRGIPIGAVPGGGWANGLDAIFPAVNKK